MSHCTDAGVPPSFVKPAKLARQRRTHNDCGGQTKGEDSGRNERLKGVFAQHIIWDASWEASPIFPVRMGRVRSANVRQASKIAR